MFCLFLKPVHNQLKIERETYVPVWYNRIWPTYVPFSNKTGKKVGGNEIEKFSKLCIGNFAI